MGHHLIGDSVYEFEQTKSSVAVIPQIQDTGMDGFVADHSHNIKCSLNNRIQTITDEGRDILVDGSAFFS